jgi:glutathione synthase
MEPADLFVEDGGVHASMRRLTVRDDADDWFQLGERHDRSLEELQILLMRRDPPFDMEYIYLTYALELVERAGVLVINRPASLRGFSEKFSIARFPECCTPFTITSQSGRIRAFVDEHGRSVVKPLDGMGGDSIFQLNPKDPNLQVILETITGNESELVMAQRYIPEIEQGDKRILLVDGEPVPYALARIPKAGDFRGNLAKGGTGWGVPLNERDYWICSQVAPVLREAGILFAGLDVIGDWLTEINVTSPTCIRELDAEFDLNIAGLLFDAAERQLA